MPRKAAGVNLYTENMVVSNLILGIDSGSKCLDCCQVNTADSLGSFGALVSLFEIEVTGGEYDRHQRTCRKQRGNPILNYRKVNQTRRRGYHNGGTGSPSART